VGFSNLTDIISIICTRADGNALCKLKKQINADLREHSYILQRKNNNKLIN